jgi:hypothetical protein
VTVSKALDGLSSVCISMVAVISNTRPPAWCAGTQPDEKLIINQWGPYGQFKSAGGGGVAAKVPPGPPEINPVRY